MDSFRHVIRITESKTIGEIRQETKPVHICGDEPYHLDSIVIPMADNDYRWAEAVYVKRVNESISGNS